MSDSFPTLQMDIHSFLTLTERDLIEIGITHEVDRKRAISLIIQLKEQPPPVSLVYTCTHNIVNNYYEYFVSTPEITLIPETTRYILFVINKIASADGSYPLGTVK